MEAFGHLVFVLIKAMVLSILYSILILLFVKKWRKWKFHFIVFFFACLLVYSCTYWGYHGLGDEKRVPVGNFETVVMINDQFPHLEDWKDTSGQVIYLEEFVISNNVFYGKLDRDNPMYQYTYEYISINLKSHQIIEYENLDTFIYSCPNDVPEKMKSFDEFYDDYFSGWRFWFLP